MHCHCAQTVPLCEKCYWAAFSLSAVIPPNADLYINIIAWERGPRFKKSVALNLIFKPELNKGLTIVNGLARRALLIVPLASG